MDAPRKLNGLAVQPQVIRVASRQAYQITSSNWALHIRHFAMFLKNFQSNFTASRDSPAAGDWCGRFAKVVLPSVASTSQVYALTNKGVVLKTRRHLKWQRLSFGFRASPCLNQQVSQG